MNIKIHNHIWDVRITDSKDPLLNPTEEQINLGLCEYEHMIIHIRSGLQRSVARATVIHELVHAFMFSYGNTVEGNEQMCDFFGAHADEIVRLTDLVMKGVIENANREGD